MNINVVNRNDEMLMALIHYFITEENYTPIVVKGAKDEVWLENLDGPYRIIRINSNHIHNKEQLEFDLFKTSNVMRQIRKKTLSLNMNALNILLNVSDDVSLENNKNIASIKVDEIDKLTEDKEMLEVFPNLASKLIKDKAGLDLIVNVTNDINQKTIRDNEAYAKVFEPKRIIVTPILILLCLVIFILMYIFGNGSEDIYTLIKFGANYQPLVKAGEVWRLVSAMFLHIGVIHLACNMYSLWIIGRQLETFLGKIKFLLVYLGSGILGSLLSVTLHSSVSAGASGAIFGLLGSLLYFGYHYRLYLGSVMRTQVIPVILLNLLIGFTFSGIDNFAHIGGLIGGYLFTMALGVPGKSKTSDKVNGWIVIIILVAFLCYMLFR